LRLSSSILTPSLICYVQVADNMIRHDAGSVSPSPRFAESAQQNGERAGVRCFVIHILLFQPDSHTRHSEAFFLPLDTLIYLDFPKFIGVFADGLDTTLSHPIGLIQSDSVRLERRLAAGLSSRYGLPGIFLQCKKCYFRYLCYLCQNHCKHWVMSKTHLRLPSP
jgi:hypothetical protein